MDSQEQCYEALLDGKTLVSRDGIQVFFYDGMVVNQSYEVEDISFVSHYLWEIINE